MSKDLILAISSNNISKVKSLLKSGVDVNQRFPSCFSEKELITPLMLAAGYDEIIDRGNYLDRVSLIQLLLKKGADPNATTDNEYRSSAFLTALYSCQEETVLLLLQHTSSEVVSLSGSRALLTASSFKREQVIEELILRGVPVDTCLERGGTPLSQATRRFSTSVMRQLLLHGADVNRREDAGETPLIVAAKVGYYRGVRTLMAHGADPSLKDIHGKTAKNYTKDKEIRRALRTKSSDREAFLEAAEAGNFDQIQVLARKVDLNEEDKQGNTAVMLACQKGHTKIAKWLLQGKVDIEVANINRENILLIAARYGNSTVLRELEKHYDHILYLESKCRQGHTALFYLVKEGHEKALRTFLKPRIWLLGEKDGERAIEEACKQKNIEILEYIKREKDLLDLHQALGKLDNKKITELLERGVDINKIDAVGFTTALPFAVIFRKVEVVKTLVNYGVDFEKTDRTGVTALMMAASLGENEILEVLLEAVAKKCGKELSQLCVSEITQKQGYLMSIFDFREPKKWILRLQQEDPAAKHIRKKISQKIQRRIVNYKGKKLPPKTFTKELLSELNPLIEGRSLYGKRAFAQVNLSPTLIDLLEEKPQGIKRNQLNRLLLEALLKS